MEKMALSKLYLNFFCREKNGEYKRFYEEHLQRGHTEEELTKALKNAGFSTVETFDGFSFNKPTKKSERVLFVAQQTAKRHVFDKFLTKKQKNSKKYVFFC